MFQRKQLMTTFNLYTMKSNSKQVRQAIDKHILECVYNHEGEEFKTLKEACNHLNNEFKRVANYSNNLKRFPNTQDRFSDYLQGSTFHFEFEFFKMDEFINGLGINPQGKEFDYDQVQKRYHYLIYSQMIKNI